VRFAADAGRGEPGAAGAVVTADKAGARAGTAGTAGEVGARAGTAGTEGTEGTASAGAEAVADVGTGACVAGASTGADAGVGVAGTAMLPTGIAAPEENKNTGVVAAAGANSYEEDPGLSVIEQKFYDCLKKSADNDLFRLSTQYGPHRDDFSMSVNGRDLKIYGSQGQMRTGALAFKMAQVDVMEEETGDIPVLLLDDVMSELDGGRQINLLKNMKSAQTFISGTDKNIFETSGTKYFHIKAGRLA